jgi:ParB family transcriptional regulator, chromosome partitioning protein
LVKPEQRKLLAKLLGEDDGKRVLAKPKHALPESLRRDLAADRLEVAQAAIARNPEIALDLLTFRTASLLIGKRPISDGPDVEFRRPRPGKEREPTTARRDLAEIGKALPTAWLKRTNEAEQFDAFRSLPQDDRLRLLAYCTALTLKPKPGPVAGDEATAYDAALSLTATSVADYWRPAKDNFLARINREQLLAISRDVLGEQWSQARRNDKKSSLVNEIDRAFAHPEKHRTPEQTAKLKSWLPQGMSFDIAEPKPAKAKKGRKAA